MDLHGSAWICVRMRVCEWMCIDVCECMSMLIAMVACIPCDATHVHASLSFSLHKYTDAESALTPPPPPTSPLHAPSHLLLGRICMHTTRRTQAIQHMHTCLTHDAMTWAAYAHLAEMGVDVDTATCFGVESDDMQTQQQQHDAMHDASFVIHTAAFVTPAGNAAAARDAAYVTPPSAQQSTTPKGNAVCHACMYVVHGTSTL